MEYKNNASRETLIKKLRILGIEVEDTADHPKIKICTDEKDSVSEPCCNPFSCCNSNDADITVEEQPNYTEFLKLHATMRFLYKYAEIMSINMRLKDNQHLQAQIDKMVKAEEADEVENHYEEVEEGDDVVDDLIIKAKSLYKRTKIAIKKPFLIKDPWCGSDAHEDYFTAVYRDTRKEFFEIPADESDFFKDSDRIRMVAYALQQVRIKGEVDISGLLTASVFEDLFPLHDGFYKNNDTSLTSGSMLSLRTYLHENWASYSNLFKMQPLDEIRDYFGEKVALYFAFIGFYTNWLIPFSLIGLFVMFYGLGTYKQDTYVQQSCSLNYTLCPLCDDCPFTNASSYCLPVQITYVFDNPLTLVYAFVVSIWATVFLEFWMRRNFELTYEWDLTKIDIDHEPVRPKYKLNANKRRVNPVTLHVEPYVALTTILPRKLLSLSFIIFSMMLVIGAVVGVIVYRLVLNTLLGDNDFVQSIADTTIGQFVTPSVVISTTASCISLIVIIALNFIYQLCAVKLTEIELPRTQQQFDDSYSLKVFCFQFVNYYSTLFYIAFFKDTLTGYPGDYTTVNVNGKSFRWAGCDGGCSYELAIQLIITMVGKQIFNNFIEVVLPWTIRHYKKWSMVCTFVQKFYETG